MHNPTRKVGVRACGARGRGRAYGREHVRVDSGENLLVRDVQDAPGWRAAGVADNDVESSPPVDGSFDELGGEPRVGDVAGDDNRMLDLGGDGGEGGGVAGVQDNLRALGCERGRAAEVFRRGGDDGDAPGQPKVHQGLPLLAQAWLVATTPMTVSSSLQSPGT